MNRHTEKITTTNNSEKVKDILLSDFSNTVFQNAFKEYFRELGVEIKNWENVFKELTEEGGNNAYIRMLEDETIVGFILFRNIQLSNGFFEEKLGFIREFWVASEYRDNGQGSELIKLAEVFFKENEIFKLILTTDTAEIFYEKRGYRKAKSYTAKNQDQVFVKEL